MSSQKPNLFISFCVVELGVVARMHVRGCHWPWPSMFRFSLSSVARQPEDLGVPLWLLVDVLECREGPDPRTVPFTRGEALVMGRWLGGESLLALLNASVLTCWISCTDTGLECVH
jgi:hypothetical protein